MARLAILEKKTQQLDETLYMGLKCMTVLLEDVELATRTDGTVSPHEVDVARARVRELVATLKQAYGV
jgi:polyhydroxyalkanoate synthesis regulator phasin